MINNTYICKTYLFKFVLSLSLALLNSLSFLNSEKKKSKLTCFNISQKYLYIKKNKKIYPPNLGPSLVRGPRQWPNRPKPRAGPG